MFRHHNDMTVLPNALAQANRAIDLADITLLELVALSQLSIGNIVETKGYATAGDGGGNLYQIVAAGTGTADGGSYIDLSGISGQAKGLFPGDVLKARQFGAPASGDSSAAIMAMNDYATAVYGTPGNAVTLLFEGPFEIANQVTLGPSGTGVTKTCNIHAGGAIFKVIAGGNLAATGDITAFHIRNCIRSHIQFSQIDCEHICGGISVENCSNSIFDGMHFHQFKWRGLWIQGGASTIPVGNSSGAVFYKVTGAEWTSGETEFQTSANFVADGIVNESADIRVAFAHIGWCGRPIVNRAGSTEYISCHPFNGNATGLGTRVDPFAFVNEAGSNVHIYDMYGDNGYIVDEAAGLNINGLMILDLNSSLTEPFVRIKVDGGAVTSRMVNVRTPIGLYTGAFTPDFSNQFSDIHYEPAAGFDASSIREFTRKVTRYIFGSATPDVVTAKQGADMTTEIVSRYYPGTGDVAVCVKGNHIAFQAGATGGGDVRVSRSKKTGISSTNGTQLLFSVNDVDVARFESSGHFRPETTGTTKNGLTNKRWSDVNTVALSATGNANFSGLGVYADNSAAVSGGLSVGDIYSTATGEVRIVV